MWTTEGWKVFHDSIWGAPAPSHMGASSQKVKLSAPERFRLARIAHKLDTSPYSALSLPRNSYDLVECDGRSRACLYLGSIAALSEPEFMSKMGAVVSAVDASGTTPYEYFGNLISPSQSHMFIDIQDSENEDISQHFNAAYQFIEEHLRRGDNVFVHCMAGISRSATLVTYWLMRRHGWKVEQALEFLKSRRPIIRPNDGFLADLLTF